MSPSKHLAAGSAFSHSGQCICNGKTVYWREKAGGEIVFQLDKKPPAQVLDRLLDSILEDDDPKKRETVKINLINKILAHYRPHAMPDQNGYYAASALVVRPHADDLGTLYIATNNERQIKDAFSGRGCAETSCLGKCQKATDNPEVPIAELYLMSGRANKSRNGTFTDIDPGHISCLCGECRQNLREHTENATFYMLPSNDGSLDLNVNGAAESAARLAAGEVWKLDHHTMYPLPEYRKIAEKFAEDVIHGYDHISNAASQAKPLKTWIDDVPVDGNGIKQFTDAQQKKLIAAYTQPSMSIPALNDYPTIENINRTMIGLIKEAYDAHDGAHKQSSLEISTVIVKTKGGKCYASVLVNGELWLPSKPNGYPVALSNALNQRDIAEVYTMTFDKYQMHQEKARCENNEEVMHKVKMPDSAALGRLLKNIRSEDHPQLYAIPVNDGSLDEARLRAMAAPSIDIRQAFGPNFTNPKRSIENGASGAAR